MCFENCMKHTAKSVYLSFYLSIYLSIYLSDIYIYLCVCAPKLLSSKELKPDDDTNQRPRGVVEPPLKPRMESFLAIIVNSFYSLGLYLY